MGEPRSGTLCSIGRERRVRGRQLQCKRNGQADLLKGQQSVTGLTKIRGLSGEVSYGRRWFAPIGQRVGAAVCSHSVGIWRFRVRLSCRGVVGLRF